MTVLIPILLLLLAGSLLSFLYHSKFSRVQSTAIIVPTLLLSSTLYWFLGGSTYYQYLQSLHEQKILAEELKRYKNSDEIIETMSRHLATKPSAKGWFLLGRLYASKQRKQDAYNAFTNAYQMDKRNFDYVFSYIQARYFIQQQIADDEVIRIGHQLSMEYPEKASLLNFMAIAHYSRHEAQPAMDYWNRTLSLLPSDSEDYQWVLKAVEQARQQGSS